MRQTNFCPCSIHYIHKNMNSYKSAANRQLENFKALKSQKLKDFGLKIFAK